MVAWAMAQVGKGYSEAPGLRCGPNSYDCSGLVYKACVNGNVRPPGGTGVGCTTTYSQWADRNNHGNQEIGGVGPFAAGVLVYFNNGDGGTQPGHVGISLGDGTMVSALGTDYGVIVSPLSYGGTPMGGIAVVDGSSNATLTKSWIGDIGSAVVGSIPGAGPALSILGGGSNPISGAENALKGIDKIASDLLNPNFMKRVGKGALAGLVGLVALLVIREGMSQ